MSNNQGQTLDAAHSFVVVVCDATGTVSVIGHLQHSNQVGQTLQVSVKEDGGGPFTVPDVSFVPNNQGNANLTVSLLDSTI